MSAPTVSLAALQRACVNVSAPLHIDRAVTLSTVLKMVRQLRDSESTHALAKALIWRQSEASTTGADRFGCWAVLDGVMDDIQNSDYGEQAAILVDAICRSLPDLVRVGWEQHHLHPRDPALASQYRELAAKWTGSIFAPRLVKRIAQALHETQTELVPHTKFPHLVVPTDALKDALWKLRREDPRPLLARRMFKLWGGAAKYPTTEADIDSLAFTVHPRLRKWFERLLIAVGCPRCDTFHHTEFDCPSLRPVQPVSLDDAIRILQPFVGNPTSPAPLEVLDVIAKLMAASKPYHQLLSAFDCVRQSKMTSMEQSALYVLATYSLVPSKLRSGGKSLVLTEAVKHHFQKVGRFEELQNLQESLQCIRSGFFAYEEADEPEKDFERWVDDLKKERLMLFIYFDKNQQVELPTINGWDRRLRRIGAHCATLCRNCLSLSHCSKECQAQAEYDHRAATDALMYHRLIDEHPEGLTVARIMECSERQKERHPLEAHKLAMAAKLLFPVGTVGGPAYCAQCSVFHHSSALCRQRVENALAHRTVWPTMVMSVALFPREVEEQLRLERSNEAATIVASYGKALDLPVSYAQAMIALAADDEMIPPTVRRNRQEADRNGVYFGSAALCFHTDLIESILIDLGRPGSLIHLQSFRDYRFPEPCVFCDTVSHSTIRCSRCPDDARQFLRLMYRHNLTFHDVAARSSAAANVFAQQLSGSKGFSLLLEELRRLERQVRVVTKTRAAAPSIFAPILTKTLPAAHPNQPSDSNSDEHAAHGGTAADDDEESPPRKVARLDHAASTLVVE